ncbi:unnamed protein product [Owenia fusiformis]|uniref:Uncharacterized protein n=1 Tax=Owenia fusiformis TaxID=6347 RepID=A0A8J1TYG4_OWEFU|nr:unnamed protein product [Owenia fusiformis]
MSESTNTTDNNGQGMNGTVIGLVHMKEPPKDYSFIYVTVICCIGLYITFNWLYCMYKAKKLHVKDNHFHIYLSIIHIFGTVRMVLFSVTVGLQLRWMTQVNLMLNSVPVLPTALLFTCIIGYIRLSRLSRPYMHISTRKMIILSLFPWAVCAAMIAIRRTMKGSKLLVWINLPVICLCCLCMTVIFIKIFLIMYKKNTKTDVQSTFNASLSRASVYIVHGSTCTKSKEKSEARKNLVNEYKRIVWNSIVMLAIFISHVVMLGLLQYQTYQLSNGIPYTNLPIGFSWAYMHIQVISFNMMPIISLMKSDKLKFELRKIYGHHLGLCCKKSTETTQISTA